MSKNFSSLPQSCLYCLRNFLTINVGNENFLKLFTTGFIEDLAYLSTHKSLKSTTFLGIMCRKGLGWVFATILANNSTRNRLKEHKVFPVITKFMKSLYLDNSPLKDREDSPLAQYIVNHNEILLDLDFAISLIIKLNEERPQKSLHLWHQCEIAYHFTIPWFMIQLDKARKATYFRDMMHLRPEFEPELIELMQFMIIAEQHTSEHWGEDVWSLREQDWGDMHAKEFSTRELVARMKPGTRADFFNVCAACGEKEKEKKFSKCAGCKLVYYCSRKCQKRDWKTHKIVCNHKD